MAEQEHVSAKHVGILASTVTAYQRYLGKLLERAAKPTSAHVGAVGSKLDVAVTVERVSSFDTEYGTLFVNSMRTAEGAVLVWRTGKSVGSVGARITIRGTIKAHSEYKGTAQTELTRCKISPAVQELAR